MSPENHVPVDNPVTLDSRIELSRGDFHLFLELSVAAGEVVALLGPNGAGKTSTLRALAGLTPLSGGWITMDGQDWDRPPRTLVPASHRPVGVVFQDYLLFGHLSVTENVAFGLRARGMKRREAIDRATRWLAAVGLTSLADAKPGRLSGGQAQRTALARALATEPRLLLLDEPLSALDAGTRMTIRSELNRHLSAFTGAALVVTHDPLDAMVLADRLVVLEDGHVVQSGSPVEVARQPHTPYVADLVGLNLYAGTADDGVVRLDGGGRIRVPSAPQGNVRLAFPPSAVHLHEERPDNDNAWHATVVTIEQHAHSIRVRLDGHPACLADVTPATVAQFDLSAGRRLWCSVAAADMHCYLR